MILFLFAQEATEILVKQLEQSTGAVVHRGQAIEGVSPQYGPGFESRLPLGGKI